MTKTYISHRQGMSDNEVAVKANIFKENVKRSGRSQHATPRFAHEMDL